MTTKQLVFEKEFGYILDSNIRKFAELAVEMIPDYFFEVPASSTGKYHPKYALGEGGLVRHTKAAVNIAYAMFGNETITGKFTQRHKDTIIVALILHDGLKSGLKKETYTVDDHAMRVTKYLKGQFDFLFPIVYDDIMNDVFPLINSHMGQWNKSKDLTVHSPLPSTGAGRYVHMCDYLASRKILEFNFDAI